MSNHTFVTAPSAQKIRYIAILSGIVLLVASFLFIGNRSAQRKSEPVTAQATARLQENYGQVPLHFEANQGQFPDSVKYLTRGKGYSIGFTEQAAVIELQGERSARVQMKLKGANPKPRISSSQPLEAKVNYFLGNDPKQWKTDVPTFSQVKYEQVYPGTDVVYYGNQQQLEYDFIVAPHADPKAIKLAFEGAQELRLDAEGNLLIVTAGGEVKQHKPIVYQEVNGQRQEVAGNYVLQSNREVSFAVSEYDVSKTLVIDPVLSYSTFFGPGPGPDVEGGYSTTATDIKVDQDGNAYITGTFRSPEFPLSNGAVRPSSLYRDEAYVFVTKFNPQGSSYLYSAVIGGTARPGASTPFALAIDDEGCAYITGWNGWRDYPRTRGVFSSSGSVFVTKLNPTGTELVFSTVLGGDGFSEEGSGIAVDREHNVYVTGHSDSLRFPVTPNAYQKQNAGYSDSFVLKLKPDASQLIFSTLIGGGLQSSAITPIVDAEGNVYFSGYTEGTAGGQRSDYKPFPTTPGAFLSSTDPGFAIGGGGYVAKLNATGSELIFSTMVKGGGRIALDNQGFIYVGGGTISNDFPTTPGAYQRRGGTESRGDTHGDAVVIKLTPDASRLVYSTFISSSGESVGAAGLAVDSQGCAYISGIAPPAGFPFTTVYNPGESPYQNFRSTIAGGFVAKLNADGSNLIYSAYIPHARPDGRLALDPQGNAYITGSARERLPTTENAYQPTYLNGINRGTHAFIAKVANVRTPERPLPLIYPLPIIEDPNSDFSFKVGGRVRDEWGRPVEDVSVAISATGVADKWLARDEIKWNWTIGANGSMSKQVVTANGGYYYTNTGYPPGANYTITPSKPGYTFNPTSVTLNRLGKNQIVSFTATSSSVPRVAVNVSAASYERTLAYNAITSAFGSDLATKTQRAITLPLPTNLAGTTVLVRDITGAERYAQLFFVSPTQVNYLMPPGTYTGRALVTIRNANGIESSEVVQVGDTAPGLFSADASGRGVAAATVQRVKADGTQSIEEVCRFDASRGQLMAIPIDLGAEGDIVYLSLYGTGVRHRRDLANISATVGGTRVRVTYAGLQSNYAGLDQINVMIPRELAGRGDVDVVLSVEDKPANVVRVKIK